MYRSLFPRDVFAELDRLQRDLSSALDFSPSIRGLGRGGYPAINVGVTPQSLEIYAFAPGMDPAGINVQIEKGVLIISGERKVELPPQDEKTTLHIDERFAGRFRRQDGRFNTAPDPGLGSRRAHLSLAFGGRHRDGVPDVGRGRRAFGLAHPDRLVCRHADHFSTRLGLCRRRACALCKLHSAI